MKKLLSTLLALLFAAGIFAQNQSVVYFTRDVSSAGLMKVYRALNQKIEGNVGIKVSFGGPDEEVLQPELLRDLVRTTGGTMFDGNGLSGNRRTSEMNLSHARRHGFTEIGKCVMVSDSDYINLPLTGGNLLKYARTGKALHEGRDFCYNKDCFPSSFNPKHTAENYDVWDFEITAYEMAQIAKLNTGKRYESW